MTDRPVSVDALSVEPNKYFYMQTITLREPQQRVIRRINRNERTQEEVQAMGLSRCNIVCMRKAGNKSINNAKYVGKM